jgi:hypothetical protein
VGGRGTVGVYRGIARWGEADSYIDTVPISKSVRGKRHEFNKETGILERKLKRVEDISPRLTKKESKVVLEIQKALSKGNNHTSVYELPKDLKINKIHVEDKQEWYSRNRQKELKGAKDPYNMTKDAPILLKKTKSGVTLIVTYSATQQGVKTLSKRYKNNKGVARNIEEAVLREQAKLVYNNMKRTNPSVYDTVHRGLLRYNSRPTSKTASKAIKTRKSTVETFADAYVLNATKRKSSLGKQQRALVRGTMHWLGDRNYNRKVSGTSKLYRLEDKYKKNPLLSSSEAYKGFIAKYTKKR